MKHKWFCPKCNNGDEGLLIRQIIDKDREWLSLVGRLSDEYYFTLRHFCGNCDMIYVVEHKLSSSNCYWEEKKKPDEM